MNDRLDREIDDTVLDRLVDGELAEGEYRDVLAALDSGSDGWRRCAMAFLEAQAWRRDLGSFRQEFDEKAVVENSASRRQWTWTYSGLITLASAASFLLAFVVAAYLFHANSNWTSTLDSLAGKTNRVPPVRNIASSDPSLPSAPIDGIARSMNDQPWGEYRLVVDGEDGQPRQIEMPIFAADDPRADLLLNERAGMPVELIRGLQQMGYQVDHQRQWTPVGQEAGKTVLVPIEELHITPVSSHSYR